MAPAVAIAGMGSVTVFGDGCDVLFDALREGRSGFHPLRDIPVARSKDLSAQIDDPARSGPWRMSDMAADAATEALAQAGLGVGSAGLEDARGVPVAGVTGLFVATTGGDSRVLEDRYQEFLDASEADRSIDDDLAEALIRFAPGALADAVAHRLGLEGPRYVATNACASGTIALGLALIALRAGRIDRALVIGADQVKASSYWGAERSGFIGHQLRPFHAARDGSVLGDGAGALVLVRAAEAADEGRALVQLAGWGVTCDENPQAITPPEHGRDNASAIGLALGDGEMDASEVGYFNAHGTGTPLIDRLETNAIKIVFGDAAYDLAVSSTKSLTGHLSAASPIIEVIATAYCLQTGWVHPTMQLDEVDPALDLDYVPLRGRSKILRAAVCNSLGGGGTNAVVTLRASCGASPAPLGAPLAQPAVVVCGCGAISRLGDGIGALGEVYAPSAAARETPFSVLDYVEKSAGYHYLSRTAQLAFGAAALALGDAGLAWPFTASGAPPAGRVAVVIGTALGGTSIWADALCRRLLSDPRRITPRMALDHGPHLGATIIARAGNVTGPVMTLTSGTNAGLQAIEVATLLLTSGACDVALVGAADAVDDPLRDAARLLARRRGHPDPAGFAAQLADGAGCMVLARRDDPAAGAELAPPKAVLTACTSWSEPVEPGVRGGVARGLRAHAAAAGDAPGDGELPLSFHVGSRRPDALRAASRDSGLRCANLGQSLAATPMLAAIAAVERVASSTAARALVTAIAPGGGFAALTIGAPSA